MTSRTHTRLLQGKDLDLLLLAGCSCLLTLLYHPVTSLSAAQVSNTSTTQPLTQILGSQITADKPARSLVLWHGGSRNQEEKEEE